MSLSVYDPIYFPMQLCSVSTLLQESLGCSHFCIVFQKVLNKRIFRKTRYKKQVVQAVIWEHYLEFLFSAFFQSDKQILTTTNRAEQKHPSCKKKKSWIYQLWQKQCLTNLILAHPGEMKLQIANVYFSRLTMATEIITYLGLQNLVFFSSLDLFSCDQQLEKNVCTHY